MSPPMTAAASTISGLRSHGARNRDGMSEGCGWLGSALVPRQRRPCKYRRGGGDPDSPCLPEAGAGAGAPAGSGHRNGPAQGPAEGIRGAWAPVAGPASSDNQAAW